MGAHQLNVYKISFKGMQEKMNISFEEMSIMNGNFDGIV